MSRQDGHRNPSAGWTFLLPPPLAEAGQPPGGNLPLRQGGPARLPAQTMPARLRRALRPKGRTQDGRYPAAAVAWQRAPDCSLRRAAAARPEPAAPRESPWPREAVPPRASRPPPHAPVPGVRDDPQQPEPQRPAGSGDHHPEGPIAEAPPPTAKPSRDALGLPSPGFSRPPRGPSPHPPSWQLRPPRRTPPHRPPQPPISPPAPAQAASGSRAARTGFPRPPCPATIRR